MNAQINVEMGMIQALGFCSTYTIVGRGLPGNDGGIHSGSGIVELDLKPTILHYARAL